MKKSVKILLILIVILVIIIPTVLIIQYVLYEMDCYEYVGYSKRSIFNIGICMALCSEGVEYNGSNEIKTDQSCLFACTSDVREKERLRYGDKPNRCRNTRLQEIYEEDDFLSDFMVCKDNFPKNGGPEGFKDCLVELEENYPDIISITEIESRIENYQVYNITIEELDCTSYPLDITLKLNEGLNNLEVKFLIEGNGGVNTLNNSAPLPGQIKQYFLEYDKTSISNVSKVEVIIKINNTIMGILDSKTC